MIRSYGFLEIKVKLDPERRRMVDLTTHRRWGEEKNILILLNLSNAHQEP